MDLAQSKLTKSEWENIEIPTTPDEKTIIEMICTSYRDLNHSYNPSSSLILHIKIKPSHHASVRWGFGSPQSLTPRTQGPR